MILESQLDIGQKVWSIIRQQQRVDTTCSACDGKGTIHLQDSTSWRCPKCRSGVQTKIAKSKWVVVGPRTVGRIEIQVTDSPGYPSEINADNYKAQKGRAEKYMCIETGIGSGSVYTLNEHIFATKAEAQQECDIRNLE
jgi:ribosomal protein L37AE/L43A